MSIFGSLPAPTSSSPHNVSLTSLSPFLTPILVGTSISPASVIVSTATQSMASGLATVIASATGQSHEGDGPGAESGECKLLGPFSLLIQAALGALALSSLVYKRWRERPRRPLKIWSFDVSKQVVGSMLLHVANLLMSMLSSGQLSVTPSASAGYQANPCSFYLLNLAIDVRLT